MPRGIPLPFLVLLCLTPMASAQTPRIGVALSGGGVRGLAHIGVLEVLEEYRVPVEFVAGSSMGGLVGGLYATGITPERMQLILRETAWNELLAPELPFREISLPRKLERLAFPSTLEFGLSRRRLLFAPGLNSGHQIGLFISRLTFPYSTMPSFDLLPIPFRCVATDLFNGIEVVLNRGSLPGALRATMAVPGVFTPVFEHGMVLVDGGLVNYLPVDVVREMGADYVIAVDVAGYTEPRGRVLGLLDILNRSLAVAIYQNARRNRRLADIVIRPDTLEYGTFDFQAAAKMVEMGRRAARRWETELRRLSLSPAEWEEHLAARRARAQTPVKVPQFLEVEGTGPEGAAAIKRELEDFVGRPLRLDLLGRELTRVAGWGMYRSARYEEAFRDGVRGLRIVVEEKRQGPPFLLPALEINTSEIQNIRASLRARIISYNVGAFRAEWRNDFTVGFQTGVRSEYFRPLRHTGWFVAPRLFYLRNYHYDVENAFRISEVTAKNAGGGIEAGYDFSRFQRLSAGYEASYQTARVRTAENTFRAFQGPVQTASLRWFRDTQDSALLPTDGLRVNAAGEWFFQAPGANSGFPRLSVNGSIYRTPAPRHTFFGSATAGTGFGENLPFLQQFTLGGPLRLAAFRLQEFRGDSVLYGAGGYIYELGRLPSFLGERFGATGWYEAGRIGGDTNQGANAGIVAETSLGTVFLGGTWGDGGRRRFYFTLGRFF
ncbi:MAG: patatin-like phospholipase family protein [Bryobacteraceae bacterium]